MKAITKRAETVVIGGGLTGLCCAIASARHGAKTVLATWGTKQPRIYPVRLNQHGM